EPPPCPPPVKRVAWADTYDADFPPRAPDAAADTIGENMPAANSFEPRVDSIEPGATLDSTLHAFEKRTLDKLDEKILAGFELLSASSAKQLPTLFAASATPVADSLQSQVAKEIVDIRSDLAAATRIF
ncbi:unnamed protein product, partial [Prorocentrum cordatum]